MLLLGLCIGYIEKMTKLDYDYGYVKLTKTCEDRDWKVEKIGAVNKLVYQAKVIGDRFNEICISSIKKK